MHKALKFYELNSNHIEILIRGLLEKVFFILIPIALFLPKVIIRLCI
jgi:hypothetical protein